MAEEKEIVLIGLDHFVDISLPLIAVVRQKGIQAADDLVVFFGDAAIFIGRGFHPVPGVIVSGVRHPVLGQQVPTQALGVECLGYGVAHVKFPEPGQHRSLCPHLFQRHTGRIPGSAQGRHIVSFGRDLTQAAAQELRLPPALFSEAVLFIIRVTVADDVDVHRVFSL